jgi:CDP-glycerol glycerophosphotransferase (TagB/SpsB family)
LRVGFLFNRPYSPYQVPHAAPYAFELSRRYPDIDVIAACSSRQERNLVKTIGTLYPGHHCQFRMLIPWYYRILNPIAFRRKYTLKRRVIRNHNRDFFAGLDALVSPENKCMDLRRKNGLKDLAMIHTRHGAGDLVFDERLLAFDFLLLQGQKHVDQISGHLKKDRFAVSGYPKFEVIQGLKRKIPRLFHNNNPIVVYNPHFHPAQSSWSPMGLEVLDFFYQNREFNLIFAPHVVLFKDSRYGSRSLPRKYGLARNIHVDTGSSASIDMTYLLAADVYLGDVSSQVYEFLLEPRPCIFLNGHHAARQGIPPYEQWGFGQVVENVETELMPALKQTFATHCRYAELQRQAFAYTFYHEAETTAAERGARAIAGFLYRKLGRSFPTQEGQ